MGGEAAPSADEMFILQLIARRAGISLTAAVSDPPPRVSHVRVKAQVGLPAESSGDHPVATYEEYQELVRRR